MDIRKDEILQRIHADILNTEIGMAQYYVMQSTCHTYHTIICKFNNYNYYITYYITYDSFKGKLNFKYEVNHEYIDIYLFYLTDPITSVRTRNLFYDADAINEILLAIEDYTQQSLPDIWWETMSQLYKAKEGYTNFIRTMQDLSNIIDNNLIEQL